MTIKSFFTECRVNVIRAKICYSCVNTLDFVYTISRYHMSEAQWTDKLTITDEMDARRTPNVMLIEFVSTPSDAGWNLHCLTVGKFVQAMFWCFEVDFTFF